MKQLSANYPNAISKIDANELLKNWEMAFFDYKAEDIYKAARVHMDISPYFPTIADIKKAINKGRLVYGMPPEAPRIAIESGYDNETGEFRCPCKVCLIADSGQCKRTKEEYDQCWY